jgi:hypothetical protein
VPRAANPIFQALGSRGMIQGKRFRRRAPDGTRRGRSNPYGHQIPSFIYGSVGEKLRSIANFAALGSPATAWLSGLTTFRNSGLRSGDVGTRHSEFAVEASKNRNFPQVF